MCLASCLDTISACSWSWACLGFSPDPTWAPLWLRKSTGGQIQRPPAGLSSLHGSQLFRIAFCQAREALNQQKLGVFRRDWEKREFKNTAQPHHKTNVEQKVNSTDKQLSVALDGASGSHFVMPFCQMFPSINTFC